MSRILVFLLLGSSVASGALIETYSVKWEILRPGGGGGGEVQVDGPVTMDYSTTFGSAEFRARGTLELLDGDSPLTLGTTLTGPLTLRFTDATIECTGTGTCGFLGIMLYAYPRLGGKQVPFRAVAGIEGTVTPQYSFHWGSHSVFGSDFSPITTTTFNRKSPAFVTLSSPDLNPIPQMFLTLALIDRPAGTTIRLPDSLWVAEDTSPVPGPVPEPGTAVTALGLGLLAVRRWRTSGRVIP